MTPNDYLKQTRMNLAAELLKDDNLTIAQVAYKVGIDDPYYFSKAFKSYFGIAPSKYRNCGNTKSIGQLIQILGQKNKVRNGNKL